ncbi:TPA: MerR family transcriptional regulator [Legionella pneumophila]|nr:MerR family transcriptional regulator [Legionella pneumophila]HAU0298295.1 MerR family transcriptional regulator [Legionella pneumophila]
MKKWHIKELSDLTNTSIRMLRHYDKIGLLTPSYREANGYRCYTAPDLAKLQQIVALKYFGLSLNTIKGILEKHTNIYAHLQAQQQVLKKERLHLQKVNEVLEKVLKGLSPSTSPDWTDLLSLIEEFNMTNNLRKKLKEGWAGHSLTESQFEEYLFLYEKFPEEFSQRDEIIEQINNKLVGDPEGPDGERVISFIIDVTKKMKRYFSEHIKLGSSILKSIQSGQLTQLEITPEGANWLARAQLSYWVKRWDRLYNNIVANLEKSPQGKEGEVLAQEWRNLINEHLAGGTRDYLIGIILWQESARQDEEIKALKHIPSPQEMVKKCHIKILFHPEASFWINQALDYHS